MWQDVLSSFGLSPGNPALGLVPFVDLWSAWSQEKTDWNASRSDGVRIELSTDGEQMWAETERK